MKFRQQQIINGYIADFDCADVGVVIELDGPIYNSQAEYDSSRDRVMAARGLTILRIPNVRIESAFELVLAEIASFAHWQAGHRSGVLLRNPLPRMVCPVSGKRVQRVLTGDMGDTRSGTWVTRGLVRGSVGPQLGRGAAEGRVAALQSRSLSIRPRRRAAGGSRRRTSFLLRGSRSPERCGPNRTAIGSPGPGPVHPEPAADERGRHPVAFVAEPEHAAVLHAAAARGTAMPGCRGRTVGRVSLRSLRSPHGGPSSTGIFAGGP